MKASELREKSSTELQTELEGLLREQFNLRMQRGIGQLNRHDQMRKVRRDIARIKTIMNEQTSSGDAA